MIELRPLTLKAAREWVAERHSHHTAPVGHLWSIGAYVDDALVGCVVVSRPVAPALQEQGCLEVTRLCTDGYPNAASRLLGAAWGAAKAMGCRRLVSYTRDDEGGTSYRAAGWLAVATTKGREWTSGNKEARWLPGMYQPSSEVRDRVRWEVGPDARSAIDD